MNYQPSRTLLTHLRSFESLRLKAYKCPAGVWTIGYGHTKGVKPGDVITKEKAERLFSEDVTTHANGIARYIRVPLTQGQMDALVDFAFNAGVARVAQSTLLKLVNQKAPTAAIQAEFKKWNKANGRVLSGLTKRCEWRAKRWSES